MLARYVENFALNTFKFTKVLFSVLYHMPEKYFKFVVIQFFKIYVFISY